MWTCRPPHPRPAAQACPAKLAACVGSGRWPVFKFGTCDTAEEVLTALRLPVGLPVGRELGAQPVFDSKRPKEISIWVSFKHAAQAYVCSLKACSPATPVCKPEIQDLPRREVNMTQPCLDSHLALLHLACGKPLARMRQAAGLLDMLTSSQHNCLHVLHGESKTHPAPDQVGLLQPFCHPCWLFKDMMPMLLAPDSVVQSTRQSLIAGRTLDALAPEAATYHSKGNPNGHLAACSAAGLLTCIVICFVVMQIERRPQMWTSARRTWVVVVTLVG